MTVVGWGVDADPHNNPTYPMRNIVHDDKGLMSWQRPALQPESVEVLQSTEHNRRTAVFGTSTPPSGLSGAIRRRAFHASEGKWSHWLLLLLADRINVVEGIADDLSRGRLPDIPGEMGVRAELEHNLSGLAQKAVVVGAAGTFAVILARSAFARTRPRRAGSHTAAARRRRSGPVNPDWPLNPP
jgi:hypothetical protein